MDKDTALQQCRKQLALVSNSVITATEHAAKAQKLANAMRGDLSEVETRALAAGNNCEDVAKAIKRIDSHLDAFFAAEPEPAPITPADDWPAKAQVALNVIASHLKNVNISLAGDDVAFVQEVVLAAAAALESRPKAPPPPNPEPRTVRDLIWAAQRHLRRAAELARSNRLTFSDEKRDLIAFIEALDG